MLQDVVETALHDLCVALSILHVAGLQVFVFGAYAVIVGVLGVFFEDALEFVASLDNGVAFGRTCYPVAQGRMREPILHNKHRPRDIGQGTDTDYCAGALSGLSPLDGHTA